jgi:glutathione S-transferase
MPAYLAHMERRLPADGFLLGEKMSVYDLRIAAFYTLIHQAKEEDKLTAFKEGSKAVLNGGSYPKTVAYVGRLLNGGLKEYLAARPQNSF